MEVILEVFLEVLCAGTGLLLFRLLGRKPPSDHVATLTGLLVWIAAGAGALAAWHWH
jgi:hypothetical protein